MSFFSIWFCPISIDNSGHPMSSYFCQVLAYSKMGEFCLFIWCSSIQQQPHLESTGGYSKPEKQQKHTHAQQQQNLQNEIQFGYLNCNLVKNLTTLLLCRLSNVKELIPTLELLNLLLLPLAQKITPCNLGNVGINEINRITLISFRFFDEFDSRLEAK